MTDLKIGISGPPRVGIRWLAQRALDLGVAIDVNRLYTPLVADPTVYGITVVRHPYDWLRSLYFAFRQPPLALLESFGVGFAPWLDLVTLARDWKHFLALVLDRGPLVIGDFFNTFYASSVLRLEDFPWGPAELFQALGYSPATCREFAKSPRTNQGGYPHIRKADERERFELRRREWEFYERFNYLP